jgi:hypothetical protein
MKLVPESVEAQRWADELGLPFHEAAIETNGHNISLIFSDLAVDVVGPGHAPFVVSGGWTGFQVSRVVGLREGWTASLRAASPRWFRFVHLEPRDVLGVGASDLGDQAVIVVDAPGRVGGLRRSGCTRRGRYRR